jgi:hypothetical protein
MSQSAAGGLYVFPSHKHSEHTDWWIALPKMPHFGTRRSFSRFSLLHDPIMFHCVTALEGNHRTLQAMLTNTANIANNSRDRSAELLVKWRAITMLNDPEFTLA